MTDLFASRRGRSISALAALLWLCACTINVPPPKNNKGGAGSDNSTETTESKAADSKAADSKTTGTPDFTATRACGAFDVDEDGSVFHFVSARNYTWEPGITLNAVFMDGSPANMQKVEEVANEWTRYANIKLSFHPPTEPAPTGPTIRISFQRSGYWSLIGSQAAYRGADTPTMNLNHTLFNQGEGEINRVVLHEFGHALGLWHEHQNPNVTFTWNKPVMYEYYRRTNGWDKDKVDKNLFRKLTQDQVKATEFDAASIMVYSFPPEFTVEHIRIPNNTVLSAMDKREIAALYPGRDAGGGGTVEPDPRIDRLSAQIGFSYTVASRGDNTNNYSFSVTAPEEVMSEIDHVLYQRQHKSFREFPTNQYYRVDTRTNSYEFAWQGWGWVGLKAKVVYKNGQVSEHTYTSAPTPAVAGPDYSAIARTVKFVFTRTPKDDKWSTYRIELDAPAAAEHIHWIEYQRQHATFPEFPKGEYLRRDAGGENFAISWLGYSTAPIGIRVRFKNGLMAAYKITSEPISTVKTGERYTSPNGYSLVIPLNWSAKPGNAEQFFAPVKPGDIEDNLTLTNSNKLVMSASGVDAMKSQLVALYKQNFPDFKLHFYGKRLFGSNEAIHLVGTFTANGKALAVDQGFIAGTASSVIVTCIMDPNRYTAVAQACERSFDSVAFGN